MTLEEIRQYIEKQLDDNETSCACGNRVSYGESCAYEKCLELLDKLEPSPFWHIEAEESPKEKGTYQVIVRNKDEIVTKGYWEGGDWFLPEKYASYNVVAWKELPKPCKKDET